MFNTHSYKCDCPTCMLRKAQEFIDLINANYTYDEVSLIINRSLDEQLSNHAQRED